MSSGAKSRTPDLHTDETRSHRASVSYILIAYLGRLYVYVELYIIPALLRCYRRSWSSCCRELLQIDLGIRKRIGGNSFASI
jgi:hypothetical protein